MAVFTLHGTPDQNTRRIDFVKELNAEQYAVVEGGDGHVLVLAGAGSGKTRTLTYRVAWLLEQGVKPEHILLLTFTNKAAREMLTRVEALTGRNLQTLWGGTYHHTCHKILRQFGARLGLPEKFAIMDEEDARDLLKLLVKDKQQGKTRFPSPSVLKSIISYSLNANTSVQSVIETRYKQFIPVMQEIVHIAGAYSARKRAAGTLDFDDLLVLTRLLLAEHHDVRMQLSEHFRYVLVDEFQDTNALQSDIVDLLAVHHKNLLVVGDDAQSIYSFRAADIQNILEFPKRYPDTKTFRLETNYRSTPQILDVANESIAHNRKQFPKQLKAAVPAGEKPFVVPASSAREEAAFVAEMMLKLQNEGLPLSEMAVLFRATHHSQSLEFELMKRDIPYEYRGGMKFFERAHVKDALAFVRIINNPRDEVSWMRVLQLGQGIGPAAARKAFAVAGVVDQVDERLLTVMGNAFGVRARGGWQEVASIFKALLAKKDRAADMLRALTDSKYKEFLAAEYPNWEERLEDIEQLAVFAERYESIDALLADISLQDGMAAMRGESEDDAARERVVLSTIHQAKGLEWHAVFVLHLADQAFPNRRSLQEADGLEEERRLFYVAVTRARRQLFLCYPATLGEEAAMLVQPSLFVDEISPHLLERMELQYAAPRPSRFSRPSSATVWNEPGWDDEVIELDAQGEAKKPLPEKKKSFLRDIDELGF